MSISRTRPLRAALLAILATTLTLTAAAPAHAAQEPTGAQPMPPLPVFLPTDTGFYVNAGVTQRTTSDGAMATVTVARPYLSPDASHSLASLAVRSADGRHNVQVGWTIDRLLNGDDQPHLFVIHRADGTNACYNVCGFEPYGTSGIRPGAPLPAGTSRTFGIQHAGDRWWILYDNQWLGSFPDTLWSGAFVKTAAVQYFGEVSGAGDPSCSEMGNGRPATSTQAARFTGIQVFAGTPAPLVSDPMDRTYSLQVLSDRGFRFGGSGRGPC